jgi:proteasome lid subunit RPN8/RPN11
MPSSIQIRREALAQILEEACRSPKIECCGMLAGSEGIITRAFPAINAQASASAYEIAPEELFRLIKEIRAAGLQMLGIYHSHPNGENSPSERDIERAYYPDAAYFIVSPLPDAANPVRAFSIRDGQSTELKIQPV